MDWGMLAAISGLFALNITIMLWIFTKLDNDIKSITEESKTERLAMTARADALNIRVDTTQGILMRMLEKQGR